MKVACILSIYCKSLLFQFLSSDIRMHILILTGVQNRRISHSKNNHVLLKNVPFEAYFQRLKSTCQLLLFYSHNLP